jgi:hypothetical protein
MLLLWAHNWNSFLYQLIVGGMIFAAGIVLPFKAGDVSLKSHDDKETLIWISVGTGLFLAFVLAWQIYAIKG